MTQIIKSVVCFGEVLWDLLPSAKVAGGAPMNVAFHVNNLGLKSRIISRVGKDELGEELLAFLKDKGVVTNLIQQDPIFPTGIVKVQLDELGQATYDIVQPVSWDFIESSAIAIEEVKSADVLVFGSLAARSDRARATLFSLMEFAETKVFDVNLRPPFYAPDLLEVLLHKADIVKMNDEELAIIAGWYMKNENERDQLKFIKNNFGLKAIIITKGKDGASFFDKNGYWNQPGISVAVEDTVGSGDSFLAAFLKKMLDGEDPQKCLEFACATGAYVATQKGGTPAIKETEIYDFLDKRK